MPALLSIWTPFLPASVAPFKCIPFYLAPWPERLRFLTRSALAPICMLHFWCFAIFFRFHEGPSCIFSSNRAKNRDYLHFEKKSGGGRDSKLLNCSLNNQFCSSHPPFVARPTNSVAVNFLKERFRDQRVSP